MPDLHDLAPTVDLDSAWHIFERTARQRRRARRRIVAAIMAAAMVAVAVAITVVSESSNHRGIEVSGSPTTTTPATGAVRGCRPEQLTASFGFVENASYALGGVVLTNHAPTPCTLSGYPAVRLMHDYGTFLPIEQINGSAGNTPSATPSGTVELSPRARQPQAGVLLDWRNWCSAPPGALMLSIQFPQWRGNLVAQAAPNADANVVAPCTDAHAPTTITVGPVQIHDTTGYHGAAQCVLGVSGSAAQRPTGISGTLRMIGGPPPGINRAVAGTVTITSVSGSQCSVEIGASGSFDVMVPVGRYTVTGRSPRFGNGNYECSAGRTISVTSAGSTSVTVVCPVR